MLEKLKELTKDTALYGISTIVGRFLGFVLVPFYTNVFLPEEFGIQSYLYAFLAFANIVYIYGMDAAFMKYSTVEGNDKKEVFSTGMLFIFLTTIVFTGILFTSFDWITTQAKLNEFSYLFYYVIGILFLDVLTLIPFSELRLERKAGKFATIKIGNIVINVALNFILILGFNYGIEAIFISNLIASAFSFLVLIPDIISNITFKINSKYLKKMIYFGLTYLPASIAAMIVQMVDVPIMRELTDDATLGIYRANYKLGIFMMLFVAMFHYAWQPFFLTNAKEKNAKEIFAKVLTLFLIVASTIWVIIAVFIDDFASFQFLPGKSLIGENYLEGTFIVPIILLAYIFHGMYINFIAGIYIEEKTQYLPIITGAGALLNVVSNFILVPTLGIVGGALSTLFSYMLMAALIYLFSQKVYRVNYETGTVIKILSILAIITVGYYYSYYTDNLNYVVKLSLFFFFFISMFIFNILKVSQLKTTINSLLKKK